MIACREVQPARHHLDQDLARSVDRVGDVSGGGLGGGLASLFSVSLLSGGGGGGGGGRYEVVGVRKVAEDGFHEVRCSNVAESAIARRRPVATSANPYIAFLLVKFAMLGANRIRFTCRSLQAFHAFGGVGS